MMTSQAQAGEAFAGVRQALYCFAHELTPYSEASCGTLPEWPVGAGRWTQCGAGRSDRLVVRQ
jgi:hypothetical protein